MIISAPKVTGEIRIGSRIACDHFKKNIVAEVFSLQYWIDRRRVKLLACKC